MGGYKVRKLKLFNDRVFWDFNINVRNRAQIHRTAAFNPIVHMIIKLHNIVEKEMLIFVKGIFTENDLKESIKNAKKINRKGIFM